MLTNCRILEGPIKQFLNFIYWVVLQHFSLKAKLSNIIKIKHCHVFYCLCDKSGLIQFFSPSMMPDAIALGRRHKLFHTHIHTRQFEKIPVKTHNLHKVNEKKSDDEKKWKKNKATHSICAVACVLLITLLFAIVCVLLLLFLSICLCCCCSGVSTSKSWSWMAQLHTIIHSHTHIY